MDLRYRAAPERVAAEVPSAIAPRPEGDGVRFSVLVGGRVVPCVVSGAALDAFDGGRHPNLRPLGVYELYQGRIDALARSLAATRTSAAADELVIGEAQLPRVSDEQV